MMKKERAIIKSIGSILFAIFASAHHWLHTLLIALGLTSLGTGLFSLSPAVKIIFLLISLLLSAWFIVVAKRKWIKARPAAWVYLVSSIISIVLVATALPQAISDIADQPQQQIDQQQNHSVHH
jgi:thiol:disulfide interchange protein